MPEQRRNGHLVPTAPASDAITIMAIIDRIASDPAVDIDKMERFMAMRRDELARQAQIAFNAAMKAAQQEMPQVVRDALNDQTRSPYAKYETISEAMQPVIAKHGFALTFGEADSPKANHVRITCDVLHEAGHIKPYHADVPIDATGMKGNPNKTLTHAFSSTVSYGRRNLKLMIFDVIVKGDAEGHQIDVDDKITKEQAEQIFALVKSTRAHLRRFCAWMQVKVVEDIPAAQFQRAIDALNHAATSRNRRQQRS
jgi:hypothetical protein